MAKHSEFKGLSLRKKGDGFTISLSFDGLDRKLDRAQFMLDSQVASDITQYMPISQGGGILRNETAMLNVATAGQGKVYLYPPNLDYGHYQWKGEKYVDPITGKGAFYSPTYGFWSRPGVEKVPSGEDLHYNEPNAHKDWGNYAYSIHKEQWKDVVGRALF